MSIQHRWVFGLAAGAGALSIAATSSLILLAQHFVEELSRPHNQIDAEYMTWTLPSKGLYFRAILPSYSFTVLKIAQYQLLMHIR